MAQYFSDKLPLSPYAKENKIAERATVMSTGLVDTNVIPEASRSAVAAAVRDLVKKEVEVALLEITDHQIHQISIHGIDKTPREAA